MRSAAEIEPLRPAGRSDRGVIAGDPFDDLDLVLFAELLERVDGLLRGSTPRDGRGDRASTISGHLLFDIPEVVVRERPVSAEVVEEAVVDRPGRW